jgi:uncharacterized protein
VVEHPNLRADVEVFVDVEKSSPHFFVNTLVRSVGQFVCDRCLEEFRMSVEERSRVIFSSDPNMIAVADEEIHPLAKDAHEIDITNDVRDALLLAVPLKAVCRPECKGLCAQCGANLNKENCRCGSPRRDVRWAGLDKFLEKS